MQQRIRLLLSNTLQSLTLAVLILCQPALAHEVAATKVMLDIGVSAVGVEMQLPVDELRDALALPKNTTAAQLATQYATQVSTYIDRHVEVTTVAGVRYAKRGAVLDVRHIRDSDWVVAHVGFSAPQHASTSIFVFNDAVIVADIATHNILVSVRRDFRNGLFGVNKEVGENAARDENEASGEKALMIGLMHYQQKQLTVDSSDGSWMRGFGKVFRLGMQHIAEGTDHVLFLLVLLLVAPLGASSRHWSHAVSVRASALKIFKTMSGFTLGHSLTLALGATGVIQFPERPIEVLIALSILVSAVHAIRPLFANREHYIAALFGLVHGMAFATSLTGFDYDSWVLSLAVLGFNLGIEAMQLLVVALVLPSLLLMRVSPAYRYVRVSLALLTGVLAIAWVLERAAGASNPFNLISDALSEHALVAAVILAALAIVSRAQDLLRWVFAWRRQSRINSVDPIHL